MLCTMSQEMDLPSNGSLWLLLLVPAFESNLLAKIAESGHVLICIHSGIIVINTLDFLQMHHVSCQLNVVSKE